MVGFYRALSSMVRPADLPAPLLLLHALWLRAQWRSSGGLWLDPFHRRNVLPFPPPSFYLAHLYPQSGAFLRAHLCAAHLMAAVFELRSFFEIHPHSLFPVCVLVLLCRRHPYLFSVA